MNKFYKLLILLVTILFSKLSYADNLELNCEGNGCVLGDVYLRQIGSSKKEILELLNNNYVDSFRESLKESIVSKNSTKLSSPKLLDNYLFGFDTYGFYNKEDVSLNFKNYNINYYYVFGGIYPRIIFALPIKNKDIELWTSISYFYGPNDIWLGLSEGSTKSQIITASAEIKKVIINYDDYFYSSISLLGVYSEENNLFVRGNSNFNRLYIKWNGDYIVNYNSSYYALPMILSLSGKYKNYYIETSPGFILGSLKMNDYFAALGKAGPVLNENDFYDVNLTSIKDYRKIILQPTISGQFIYDFDHFKLGLIYQPTYDFKIHTMVLRFLYE